jgi:hypothetical protein
MEDLSGSYLAIPDGFVISVPTIAAAMGLPTRLYVSNATNHLRETGTRWAQI